ncbi:MAG: hypothetical protein AAGU11_12265, partial [Syntrophobacteraceae bacterium]
MNSTNKYVLVGLWGGAGVSLIWLVASDWHMNALLWFFIFAALALAWWGLKFRITEKTARAVSLSIFSFWSLFAFLLFFPFPVPDAPEYIVGEVHRFSELEHGWARAATGALGPNLAGAGWHVYNDPSETTGLDPRLPGAIAGFPAARSFFGGTLVLEPFRAGSTKGGVPPTTQKYAL